MNSFLSAAAKSRLMEAFPADGAARFERLQAFGRMAAASPGVAFVVPPDIDSDLHEVLAARDENGRGFETMRLCHYQRAELGQSIGKRLREIDHPLVKKTLELCLRHGFHLEESASYKLPVCTLTVLP